MKSLQQWHVRPKVLSSLLQHGTVYLKSLKMEGPHQVVIRHGGMMQFFPTARLQQLKHTLTTTIVCHISMNLGFGGISFMSLRLM